VKLELSYQQADKARHFKFLQHLRYLKLIVIAICFIAILQYNVFPEAMTEYED